MKTSQIVDQMRPEPVTLDPQWSASSLRSILGSPHTPRSQRRLRPVVLGAAGLVLASGGIAYATGNVPAFIEEGFDEISPSSVHDVRRIASFTLASGSSTREFEVFRATNDDGETCIITHEADGRFGPSDDGACAVDPVDGWFGWTAESARVGESFPDSTLYIYGERPTTAVTRVRAYGAGFDHTMRVNPLTGGFATAVPEVTLDEHGEVAGRTIATLDYLGADGNVIDSKSIKER